MKYKVSIIFVLWGTVGWNREIMTDLATNFLRMILYVDDGKDYWIKVCIRCNFMHWLAAFFLFQCSKQHLIIKSRDFKTILCNKKLEKDQILNWNAQYTLFTTIKYHWTSTINQLLSYEWTFNYTPIPYKYEHWKSFSLFEVFHPL